MDGALGSHSTQTPSLFEESLLLPSDSLVPKESVNVSHISDNSGNANGANNDKVKVLFLCLCKNFIFCTTLLL